MEKELENKDFSVNLVDTYRNFETEKIAKSQRMMFYCMNMLEMK
jgi:hypothetical protein